MTHNEMIKSYNDTLKSVRIEYRGDAFHVPKFKCCVRDIHTKKCLGSFKDAESAVSFAKENDYGTN